MRKTVILILVIISSTLYAQGWNDGMLLTIEELDIMKMNGLGIQAANAILKVAEQYVDQSYRYLYISQNYILPSSNMEEFKNREKKLVVALIGYPEMNKLLYAQVFFGGNFFLVAFCKRDTDMKKTNELQITKMNYDKYDRKRRDVIVQTIQKENIVPLGIQGS